MSLPGQNVYLRARPVTGRAGPGGGVDLYAQPDLDGGGELLPLEVEAHDGHGGAVEPLASVGKGHRGQPGHLALASGLRVGGEEALVGEVHLLAQLSPARELN